MPQDTDPTGSTNIHPNAPRTEMDTGEVAVVAGPDSVMRVTIPEGGLRIGTASGNQLRLTDPTVSRIHYELRLRAGSVQLTDAGKAGRPSSRAVVLRASHRTVRAIADRAPRAFARGNVDRQRA